MHVRFSTAVGRGVMEEGSNEEIAFLTGILLNPDTGKVEGFFVRVPGFLHSRELFLSGMDILHWGKYVRVRDADVLVELADIVRLEELERDGRPVLGQRIVTEGGQVLGVCRDVQFDTKTFYLEWLFPKKMLRWKTPLPASSIVVVRHDAIIVRDAVLLPAEEKAAPSSVLNALDPLGSGAAQGMTGERSPGRR